jgi:hypothetical protein
MRRHPRTDDRESRPPGDSCENTCPFLRSGVRGKDVSPLDGIAQEDSRCTRATGRSSHAISAEEEFITREAFEMGVHIRKPNFAIRDQIVEMVHEFGFGQDRKLVERFRLEPSMKPAVEIGVGVGVPPESAEFVQLMSCDPICGPTLMLSEPAPHGEQTQE